MLAQLPYFAFVVFVFRRKLFFYVRKQRLKNFNVFDSVLIRHLPFPVRSI